MTDITFEADPANLPFLNEAARLGGVYSDWESVHSTYPECRRILISAHAKSLKELGWTPPLEAEIDRRKAEPDWELYRDAVNVIYSHGIGGVVCASPMDEDDIRRARYLIAAMPHMPKVDLDQDDGWIHWHGGNGPPVYGNVLVKFRDGRITRIRVEERSWRWGRFCKEDEIIAYRRA
jgi:hypothetical protein